MNDIVLPIRTTKYVVFINYSYIVVDRVTRDALVVDPAWDFDAYRNALTELGANLKAVLLTHAHFDHVNLVKRFEEAYSCDFYMSRPEVDEYGFRCANLCAFAGNDIQLIGSMSVKTHITPGHTLGSTCYIVGPNLFTGDTLFVEGCGICWGKGADPDAMYDSLNELKQKIPSHFRVFPGHSYGTTPGVSFAHVLENNVYMNIEDRERFINFRMRKNQKGLFTFK